MNVFDKLPRISFGLYPTPLYKLENISRKYGKNIWIKRDDLCGVGLGGNKVRKLEFLLADAKAQGCDVVFTTGGAQSNHAMLTAACAARLGMKYCLYLKKRGVTDHKGNLVLDDIYGAEVRLIDTDSYDDIYNEMHRTGDKLAEEGHKSYYIPCGGSNALGAIGYACGVEEISLQAKQMGLNIGALVSAAGSGGTTAGLLLGAKLFMKDTDVYGIAVDTDPFEKISPDLAEQSAQMLHLDPEELDKTWNGTFTMYQNFGAGYAIPNKDDTFYIKELAQLEGILLDPVYTGKAWSGLLQGVQADKFDKYENILFVHTGGAAALFAMDLG